MTPQFSSNDGHLSRLKMPPQSKIPKPKVDASSHMLSSFPVHLLSTEVSLSEPCTPANNSNENLDLLLDSGLKAQMATAGEEHTWLIGTDRGSDVDELLDQFLEFEDCIDGEVLTSSYVPSDVEESQGSHAGPLEDTCSITGGEEQQEKILRNSGYLQAFVGKLCSMAKTLEWLKAQPFSFTPETPLDLSNVDRNAYSNDRNASSGAASSCKSSRSLSAAFDRAAGLSSVSNYSVSRSIASQLNRHYEGQTVEDEDEEDDFLSAYSEICQDATASTTAVSPSQSSMSSESSGADSEEMHRSLLKTSIGTEGVSDWLSSG
jgi:hypothetical protein